MSEQGTFPTPSRRQKRRRRRFHRRRGGQRRSSSSSHRKLFLVIIPTTTTTSSSGRGNRPPSGGVQRSQRSHFFSFPKTKLSIYPLRRVRTRKNEKMYTNLKSFALNRELLVKGIDRLRRRSITRGFAQRVLFLLPPSLERLRVRVQARARVVSPFFCFLS